MCKGVFRYILYQCYRPGGERYVCWVCGEVGEVGAGRKGF